MGEGVCPCPRLSLNPLDFLPSPSLQALFEGGDDSSGVLATDALAALAASGQAPRVKVTSPTLSEWRSFSRSLARTLPSINCPAHPPAARHRCSRRPPGC